MPAKNTNTGFRSLFSSKLDEDEGVGGVGAVGGAEFTPGNGYKYHIFTSNATLNVKSGGDVDVMLVGGGGGGGNGYQGPGSRCYAGGGGGAGGMKQLYDQTWKIGTYTIDIGGGGRGAFRPLIGAAGGTTTISSPVLPSPITAGGGGYGANFPNGTAGPSPGGSGGGGAAPGGSGGSAPSSYGNTGSSGSYSPPFYYRGGGGGGAGSAGSSDDGGIGLPAFSGDTGIPPAYGTPGPSPGRYFAGGGAGTYGASSSRNPGSGGAGGGGSAYSPGTINTGGGGAGNLQRRIYGGGHGGPGIVIIRYAIG